MNKFYLQFPIEIKVKESAMARLKNDGLKNLQALGNFLITQYAQGKISIGIANSHLVLNEKALQRLMAIESQIEKDVLEGNFIETESPGEVINFLNNDEKED